MEGLELLDIPEEELNRKIDDEKKANLLNRVQDAIRNDTLCIRDWLGIYEILLKAMNREIATRTEDFLSERFGGTGNEKPQ